MTSEAPIIDFAAWLQTPPGRHLLAWEQAQVDAAVIDLFGFHALQLGLPELDGLLTNRMPHRWLAGRDLMCNFDELPFESASLDLVLLPHALELAPDAHALLREVERVLRPEGRVIVFGLNPASLWGLRQKLGRLRRRGEPYLPRGGEFIGYWRMRDWLKLLSFDVEAARFGIYRPPLRSEAWLQRWRWADGVGSRWWPVLGAVYFIQAVKRVQGMRMIGLSKNKRLAAQKAPAVALNNHHKKE
jgi:SAM-dependent methyltransferase